MANILLVFILEREQIFNSSVVKWVRDARSRFDSGGKHCLQQVIIDPSKSSAMVL